MFREKGEEEFDSNVELTLRGCSILILSVVAFFKEVVVRFFSPSSMDAHVRARFTLGKQSSLRPAREGSGVVAEELDDPIAIDPGIKLMYLANDGDVDGIRELLDSGTDVNFHDSDGRTSLHVAACQGRPDVVELLLRRGAEVDVQDCWGSTVSFWILRFW